jgi:threonine dehydrogenase-like Zn-dependent dehydrogenase
MALDEQREPAWQTLKRHWRHGARDRGADLVLQCRATDRALAGALRALRPQGTVIDLAFYDGGAPELRLGDEFHHNGLTVRAAQIGRVPRGLAPRWTRERLQRETLALLAAHAGPIERVLLTDRIPFDEGPAFLTDLAARRRHALLAVLEMGV